MDGRHLRRPFQLVPVAYTIAAAIARLSAMEVELAVHFAVPECAC